MLTKDEPRHRRSRPAAGSARSRAIAVVALLAAAARAVTTTARRRQPGRVPHRTDVDPPAG